MTKPISPNEVVETKKTIVFPSKVIEAWNFLIAKNYSAGKSVVKQDDAVKTLIEYLGLDQKDDRGSRNYCYENRYLDIEEVYRNEGWSVEYDKPAYYETYEPTFTFKKGKSR